MLQQPSVVRLCAETVCRLPCTAVVGARLFNLLRLSVSCNCFWPQDFVLAVHSRAASAGASGGMSKRAEIMLELVMDIKNNRLREGKASKAAAAAAAAAGKSKGRGGAAAVLQPGLLRWLKQLGVDDVTLSNISWAKLVQPNKKGEESHGAGAFAAFLFLEPLLVLRLLRQVRCSLLVPFPAQSSVSCA